MPFATGHIAAASNRADLMFRVELIDPQTNDFVDLTDASIVVALGYPGQWQSAPILTGTNADSHVIINGPGEGFDVWFTRAEMTQLSPGEYDIGITVTLNTGKTYQIFAGQLPVVHGVVAA